VFISLSGLNVDHTGPGLLQVTGKADELPAVAGLMHCERGDTITCCLCELCTSVSVNDDVRII
jgi:hypothetical protein